MEDQRQGAPSKTTINDLLDTLKLLEAEPEKLPETKTYCKEKYAWMDEVRQRVLSVSSARPVRTGTFYLLSRQDRDPNSLTTDNLERHGQSHHPVLPDGGALLSEAKLQSIMSFLDEMEKSEQERPRSVTSGSHREVGG